MNITLLEKARQNRKGAVTYVADQKARLIEITGLRRSTGPRVPFPSIGFSSIRPHLTQAGSAA